MTEQTNLCSTPEQDSTRNDNLPDSIKDSMAMMMTEMMASFKQDLLTQFDDYFSSSALEEGLTDTVAPENGESSAVADAVDTYLNAEAEATPSQSTPFANLAAEFSTADKTGPPIDEQLAHLLTNNWPTLSTNYAKISYQRRNLMPFLSNIIDRATATILSLRKSVKLSGSS